MSYLAPATQVSAQGVRRAWPRRRWIPWGEVDVVEADPIERRTVLVLLDGSRVSLPFGSSRAAEVAMLGGRPVRDAPPPMMASAPVPGPRTDADTALRARAATLAAENARMTAELARLRSRSAR